VSEKKQIRAIEIEVPDVQGIILRGYGSLPRTAFLLFEVGERDVARRWLAALVDQITTAAQDELGAHCTNVAFTHRGFERLGLHRDSLAGFSNEFGEGLSGNEHRSRTLGDVDENRPATWEWGGPERPVDGLLLLYARTEAALEAHVQAQRRLFAGALVELARLDAHELPGRKEHFGFRDGIAQPRILNANVPQQQPGLLEPGTPANTVAAGEFLFGYPNEYDQLPLGPRLAASLDPQGDLAACPNEEGVRDFARNGSYLVFRQLRQDVRAFWEFVAKNSPDEPEQRAWLAAKIVGRWPSGAPVVSSPDHDAPELAHKDDFGYAELDPHGYRVPLGAHVRRANPRDWFLANDPESSIQVVKRHRIIRRGRPYGPPLAPSLDPEAMLNAPPSDAERGLHFLCFNSDIERQFELIQHQWMNSPKFAGLSDDPDPVAGAHPSGTGTLTLQDTPIRKRISPLPRFVTVSGGAYFFMPGLRALRYLSRPI
jgi:Dyp-type peroxidase family